MVRRIALLVWSLGAMLWLGMSWIILEVHGQVHLGLIALISAAMSLIYGVLILAGYRPSLRVLAVWSALALPIGLTDLTRRNFISGVTVIVVGVGALALGTWIASYEGSWRNRLHTPPSAQWP
jgi:hypothetical protein